MSLNRLNQPYKARPSPIFRKKNHVKLGRFDLKCEFYTLKNTFQIKIILILIGSEMLFHVNQSDFRNIQWFLSYTQKCVKKWQKLALQETLQLRNQKKILKFRNDNSKTIIQNVLTF